MPKTIDLAGKLASLSSLVTFATLFRNWGEIWWAYRSARPLPSFRLRGGLVLHHRPGDDPITIHREIFVDHCYTGKGFYDPRAGDHVLDIGANNGYFAVYLHSVAPGIKVDCFEPGASTREMLARNLVANGVDGSVRVHPFAVSDQPGEVKLRKARDSAHQSMFDNRFVSDEIETVECITLEQAIAKAGCDRVALLKIDTEGAEIEIVEGLPLDLWSRVDRVVVEFHDLFRPGCRDRVLRVLSAAGFDSIEVDPPTPEADLGVISARRTMPPA